MRVSPLYNWLVTATLFLSPTLVLTVRGGAGYCFFTLLLLALGAAIANRRRDGYFSVLRTYPWFTASMLALPCAIIVQQIVGHFYLPRQIDALSRFILVLPIFVMLCHQPSRNLKALGWGCAAGAIAVGAWGVHTVLQSGWTEATRLNNAYTNAIPFGDTALLLAFLSVFTLGWDQRGNWGVRAVKLFALFAGGYASYLSGTRGGWLAVPVFLVLLGFEFHWFAHWKRVAVASIVVVVAGGALLSSSVVRDRIGAATSDIQKLQQGQEDTSVGLRLQLWQASWLLYSEHPVYGVGKGHLERSLRELADHGIANTRIVNERAHSDFFSTLAEMGTIGVICLLLVYYGWSVYFWRHARSTDPATAAACYSGLAVSLSSLIYGLTIDVFVPVMNTTLLSLMVAALLAMVEVRRREMKQADSQHS